MITRTKAPEIRLPEKINIPNIEKALLQNKLPIHIISGATEPIVHLTLMLEAGRMLEEKKLVAELTAKMLKKGTATKTAQEIAEGIDFLGANIKIQANMYLATINVSCLTSKLENVLMILSEILTEPTFPEKELESLVETSIDKLKVNREKNNYVAAKNFNQVLYGSNHPIGYQTEEVDYKEVTVEDLKMHYERHYPFNDFTFIILSGNIGNEEKQIVDKYLGKLPRKATSKLRKIDINSAKRKALTIEKSQSVQSSIMVGNLTIDAKHEDFIDLNILITLFGGYFGSRLMTNIREEKGYTYGIYAFLNPILDKSILAISTSVGKEYTQDTLKEISNEIIRLKNELITIEELDTVKNYMIGKLMKSVDGPLKMGSTLKKLCIFEQDEGEINKKFEAIKKCTPERLQQLALKYLNFEEMYKVVSS